MCKIGTYMACLENRIYHKFIETGKLKGIQKNIAKNDPKTFLSNRELDWLPWLYIISRLYWDWQIERYPKKILQKMTQKAHLHFVKSEAILVALVSGAVPGFLFRLKIASYWHGSSFKSALKHCSKPKPSILLVKEDNDKVAKHRTCCLVPQKSLFLDQASIFSIGRIQIVLDQ